MALTIFGGGAAPDVWHLLVGTRPPFGVTTEYPTDGVWTYSYESASWFSPAYAVSWQAGDNVGQVPVLPGEGSGAVQASHLVGGGRWASDQAVVGAPRYDWPGDGDGTVIPASSAGSGTIFLIMQEEGGGGPTEPPQPDLDVLDYLGDLVLTDGTNVVPWGLDMGDGEDGDWYLHGDAKTLYGPRHDGIWDSGFRLNVPVDALEISPQSDLPILTGYSFTGGTSDLLTLENGASDGVFRVTQSGETHPLGGVVLTSPNDTAYRLIVANDGTLSTEPAS